MTEQDAVNSWFEIEKDPDANLEGAWCVACEMAAPTIDRIVHLDHCPVKWAMEWRSLLRLAQDALRPFAKIGLWEDNYPEGSEERAECIAEDNRLDVFVLPSAIRAARDAISPDALQIAHAREMQAEQEAEWAAGMHG